MVSRPSDQPDASGTLIGGRYRLIERAGRGSVAEVWRAEAMGVEGFGRTVALKRLIPRFANDAEQRRLFVREARLNGLLDHPNVVQVLDLGADQAGLYRVSEWVDGLSMRDIRSLCVAFKVRTSPLLVAAIGIEVLRALEAAHHNVERFDDGTRRARPVIHRNLSPCNVLLSVRGVVKLADFGLGRPLDEAALSPDGVLVSKIRYMAPELAAGQAPDARADLYSCGAMLWEAMTNVDLWAGQSPTQIAMALARGQRPPPVRELRSDVPVSLAAAIDRALAPRYVEGYRVAATFARDLSDALRMIPERTDTTRLANEVENALCLRRQLLAQQKLLRELQMHRLKSTRPAYDLPNPEESLAPRASALPARDSVRAEGDPLGPRRRPTLMAPIPKGWSLRADPPPEMVWAERDSQDDPQASDAPELHIEPNGADIDIGSLTPDAVQPTEAK